MGTNNNNTTNGAAGETRNFVSTAKLKLGQSIGGTVLALVDSEKYSGKTDLLMRDANGEEFLLYVSGTLKRAINDGEIAVGQTIVITRQADITANTGRSMSAFSVKQVKAAATVGAAKQANGSARPRI